MPGDGLAGTIAGQVRCGYQEGPHQVTTPTASSTVFMLGWGYLLTTAGVEGGGLRQYHDPQGRYHEGLVTTAGVEGRGLRKCHDPQGRYHEGLVTAAGVEGGELRQYGTIRGRARGCFPHQEFGATLSFRQ